MCGGRVRIHQKGETGGVVILWSKKGGYSLLVKFFLGKSLSVHTLFLMQTFLYTDILQKIKNANFGIKGGMNWNFGYDQQQSDMHTIIT